MAKARFEVSGIDDSLKPLLSGTQSSNDMRNQIGSLHQTDFAPLRARGQGFNTMTVWVNPAVIEGYYMGFYNTSGVPCTFPSGASPQTWAPASNPRIDILHVNSAEPNSTLFWVSGTQAAAPSIPSVATSGVPICAVFHRVGSTKILDADDTTNSYIYRDMRPLYNLNQYSATSANALSGSVVKTSFVQTNTQVTCSITIPADNTIPAITEGNNVINLTHTPTDVNNTFIIEGEFQVGRAANETATAALFRDATSAAIHASITGRNTSDTGNLVIPILHKLTSAPAASGVTFSVRVGAASGPIYFNGDAAGGALMGGVMYSALKVTEIKA